METKENAPAVAALYHRHGTGLDLVPGDAARCVDPDSDPNLVLAFTPESLATYIEGHMARTLREAAEQVRRFKDWYPTSVFPSLDEALSDDPEWRPTTEQVAASSYRHAYGDLVPRNLRRWADEIEAGDEPW